MKNYFYILCSFFIIACESEEIKPRTNPQFSIAFIQDIDESGVEFAANIYDYGSVEILEYGFVYDRTTNVRVEHSELVKMEGRPEKFFSLKAVHTMVKGQKYNVAAYIKTTESVVYSALMTFVSEGSTGFIYEKIEMQEPIYFGDTVTVWGSNMSRQSALYQFYIQGTKADILEVNEKNFKVKLPKMFDFPEEGNLPLNLEIRVADKIVKISEKFEFKAPTFLLEPTTFNYIDTLIIRGQFLDSKEVSIRYIDGNTAHNIVPISVSSEKVVFIPKVEFKSMEPEFSLTIRGKSYSFKYFKINQTDLIEKYAIRQSLYSPFSIEVTNPNPYFPQLHWLHVPDINNSYISPVKVDKSSITYQISTNSNIIYPRNFKMKLLTLENTSAREIEFSVTDPLLKHMGASLSTNNSRGISHEGKGYMILQEEIRKVDPNIKTINKIVTVPDSNFPAALFLLKHATGKMYMGGYNRNGDRVLRSFDPITNSVELLGKIPSNVKFPNAAYITDRYLYYEGTYRAYSFVTYRDEDFEERYRYDLLTSEWQKLENVNDHIGNNFYWRPFSFEGSLYTFRRDRSTGRLQLQRFIPNSERWEVISTYAYHSTIFEVFVLEEFVYYNDGGGKYRINMKNREREKVSNINFNFGNHFSFQDGNKFYHYTSSFFYEFDPEYFTYHILP